MYQILFIYIYLKQGMINAKFRILVTSDGGRESNCWVLMEGF